MTLRGFAMMKPIATKVANPIIDDVNMLKSLDSSVVAAASKRLRTKPAINAVIRHGTSTVLRFEKTLFPFWA